MNKTIYCYDGTFEGLLTTLAVIGEIEDAPADITRARPAQVGLFCNVAEVETEADKSGLFLEKIEKEISLHALRNVHHAFLAETAGIEMAIYRYLALGRREGRRLDGMLANDNVLPVHQAARRVKSEAYRMKGFVRFREVRQGLFYAPLGPDYRILSLIAPHFAARFSDQNWVIHDVGRREGIIHDGSRRQWVIIEMDLVHDPYYTDNELFFSELWQRYFARSAIAARLNPKLQKSRLPLKHRKYLVEMENCRQRELTTADPQALS
jgi:probable DNA metabolism protein